MNEDSKPPFAESSLRVIIFMDGGYVRQTLNDIQAKKKGDTLDQRKGKEEGDKVDYSHISKILLRKFSVENGDAKSYFYDGIPDAEKEPELYKKQVDYLQKIRDLELWEVREGQLIRSDTNGLEQKGVDDLIAKDMTIYASENWYDVAILVSGDEDLLDAVRKVKNTGKKVFGAYFRRSISSKLKCAFNKCYEMTLYDFD